MVCCTVMWCGEAGWGVLGCSVLYCGVAGWGVVCWGEAGWGVLYCTVVGFSVLWCGRVGCMLGCGVVRSIVWGPGLSSLSPSLQVSLKQHH